MRPHEVAASVEPAQWEAILAAVREHNPDLWRDLERAACQDQRIPPRLWQRYGAADRRALVRRALGAPASGPLALDVLREYLLAEQRPLVMRFLDLAGVPHEEGVLLEGPVPEPAAAQLDAAIDTLLAETPRATALLYLRALSAQDNVEWPRLEARLAAESRAPAPAGAELPARSTATASAPPATPPATPRAAPTPAERPRPPAAEPEQRPRAQAPTDQAPGGPAAPDVTGHAAIAPPPRPTEPRAALTPSERAPQGPPVAARAPEGKARGASGDDGGATSAASAADNVVPLTFGATGAVASIPRTAPEQDRPGGIARSTTDAVATAAPSAAAVAPAVNRTRVAAARQAPVSAPAAVPPAAAARPRPLPSNGARRSERAAAPSVEAAPPEHAAAPTADTVRNGATASVAPLRDRRGLPRAPRLALAARLPAPPPEPPGLTALDRLLLRARADTLVEAPGAADVPELQAAVAEVVGLSAQRPASAYHLGLLAASGDAPASAPAPGWGAAHLGWYHAGRLAGWAQRQDWPAIARFYADEPGAAAMLFRHADLNAWAGAWLLVGLLGADVPALAADVLRHCPAVASLAARATLLDAADALLHGDRPAEASAILDVLAGLPPLAGAVAMASAGPPPSETREAAPERPPVADALDMADRRDGADARQAASYAARLRRAQAECLQAQGLFGAARARLEAALAQAAGAERAGLLGALGLVAGEFAQLAELRLPEAEMDPAPWRRRLVAGAPYFREALAAALDSAPLVGEPAPSSSGGATATAQVGLGALEWLSERPAAARPHFEAALEALQAQPAAHQRRGVLPQAQFYLGACLLLDLDAAARERALDLLHQAIAAGFRASPRTWQRLLDLVALDPSLAVPLFTLFSQQAEAGDEGAAALPADLVQGFLVRCAPRSDAARHRLAQECARADLPAAERWEMLLRLLRAQRQAGDPDGARATLDALEGLALGPAEDSHARLQRWCDFLADPANYEPEWSWDDVLWSRVRTFELLGRDDEAFWLLDAPFSRLLAEATPEALAAAEDVLAHARAVAVSPEARAALPEMTARLRARQEAARQECALDEDGLAAQLRAGRVLRVLFVGGNETQARHERELRAALEQRDEASGGRVVLEFRTPGFNSNWDKTLEAVRGYRGRVDALVLMPFVRTQLGRALRRLASEFDIPWVPCTGKGYDSMERALRLAILLAASR